MLRVEKLRIGSLPSLSFAVADGECLAVEGPSGSGKTRILRAIADLDPNEGQLFLEKDDHTGAVYVRPVDTTRPVNVFVTADSGRTYALVLQPVDMPADTIVVRDRNLLTLELPRELDGTIEPQKAEEAERGATVVDFFI